jgi:Tfp pilus assembly protein PilX
MRHPRTPKTQSGAALPIALILLAVITLLAVAAMRSTSFGFVMATNQQLQERAFVAAEAGIEQAISTTSFNPAVTTPITATGTNGPSGDTYTTTVVVQNGGQPQGAVFGSSWNTFSTFQFQIVSTGTSARGASTTHTQGVAIITPNQPTYTGGTGGL